MPATINAPVYTESRIKSNDPLHEPKLLTEKERERFRRLAKESRLAKEAAMKGKGPKPLYSIYSPNFNPDILMPRQHNNGIAAISLFSGGGGLDLGFDLAGFEHVGSWELLEEAAATLSLNRPEWNVHGGDDGDVRKVDWLPYRGKVEVVHGGPRVSHSATPASNVEQKIRAICGPNSYAR